MRSLLDILEDERRLVYKINALLETGEYTKDFNLIRDLYIQKEKYMNQLDEVRDELLEYAERLLRQQGRDL